MKYTEQIPRESPEVHMSISGREHIANWYNTQLFVFARYPQLNHVFINTPDYTSYIFNCQDTIDDLNMRGFTVVYAQEPSDEDVEVYFQYQIEGLHDEIEAFFDD